MTEERVVNRRTFVKTVALGAAFLAGCAKDGGSSAPPRSSTTTPPPPTTPAAPTPTTTSIPTTAAPVAEPLPRSDTWWLDGNFGPVTGDLEVAGLTVSGQLPAALAGTWVRNGPNPSGGSAHWFLGNGMAHGLRLREGTAEWYKRRTVQTPFASGADNAIPGGAVSYSNVSSVFHGGRLLSLGELGFPYELQVDDLATVGPYDFAGRLTTNMTAHPKIDPQTGELFFFGYDFAAPYLTYMVADRSGALQRVVPIGIGTPTMVHDFAITEQSAVFLDLAVQFAPDQAGLPYRFDRTHRCRVGVIDRGATTDTTRWFDIEPGFVFHTVNASQTGSVITLDVIRYDELWTSSSAEPFSNAVPYRYTIDVAAGRVTEGALDDRASEFPMIDQRFAGRRHTVAWGVGYVGGVSAPTSSAVLQYGPDGSSAGAPTFALPAGDIVAEPLFVGEATRPAEGGGWLLAPVFRAATNTSDLVVFDAQAIDSGPVATVQLPVRVPFGFHASWAPLSEP